MFATRAAAPRSRRVTVALAACLLLLGPILASVLSAASRPVPARTGDA